MPASLARFTFLLLVCFSLDLSAGKLPLWHIENGKSEIYLLGSIHALKQTHYPLPAAMEEAFERASAVVVEVDLTRVSQYDMAVVMREFGYYPASQSLQGNLSPATLQLLESFLRERGMSPGDVSQVRPWLLSLNLGVQELLALGYQPALGVDQYFIDRAVETGKPIEQLETYREQIELLAADPAGVQDIALRAALEEMGELKTEIEALISAWQEGDTRRMYEISRESTRKYPELDPQMERIIDDRNRTMARQVLDYATREGTWLIIVGALHMAGDKGIVDLIDDELEVVQISE